MIYLELILLVFFLVPAVFAAFYHFTLGISGIFLRPRICEFGTPRTRFAILIPAHNEENGIGKTLEWLKEKVDYPAERVSIYVVADNCTDQTANVAEDFGVHVLQRNDPNNRGKGYALQYAIPILFEREQCDGILVVDADCTIDRHALRSIDSRASEKPESPLQLNYVVDNPDESPMSFLLGIANVLENEFFYVPKDRFGLFVMLRGTGMYIPRVVLEKHPWSAFSIVEDTDYTLELLKDKIAVGFIGEAKVLSEFPAENEALTVQRKRWIGGTLAFSIARGLSLIFRGLFTLDLRGMDAGITMLVLSRPLIITQLCFTTLFSFFMIYPAKSGFGPLFLGASTLCWILYVLYFLLGVNRLGLTRKRKRMLLRLPGEVLSYMRMALKSLWGRTSTTWDRTPRKKTNSEE